MAKLKAGTAATEAGFSNSMATAIEQALNNEWNAIHGEPMPHNPRPEDSRMLFAAIAQGVLDYLYEHRADISTTTHQDTTSGHNHSLDFDFEVSST